MRPFLRVLGFVAACAMSIHAAQQSAGPSFEVASVKRNTSGDNGVLGFQSGGRFRAVNITLWRLLAEAYADAPGSYPASRPLPRFRIVGGPSWLDTERFDVEARPEGNPDAAQSHAMLRTLLADRFRVLGHLETRELPIYRLVKTRADGRLGPQLRESPVDCAALRAAGTTLPGAALPAQQRPCVMRFGRSLSSAAGLTMSDLADVVLSLYTGRMVVDRTGLTGPFEWTLEWTPDQLLPTVGGDTRIDPNGPSLFAALQEQLGLKLEPATGPVSVLVVERADLPTEN
jgi:uncharacterized protein (TIGR03435 family)